MPFTLAFTFVLAPGPLPAPAARDAWFGRDKVAHFVAAAAVQSVAYALVQRGGASRPAARWRATAITAAVSLGKEGFDLSRGRPFSVRDLAWDAGGAGAATAAIMYASRK